MKSPNSWRVEIEDKWYANLSCRTLNSLQTNGILENPEEVKKLCLNGELIKIRNFGKKSFNQVCVALGVEIRPKIANSYCPHCSKPIGIQMHILKETEVDNFK